MSDLDVQPAGTAPPADPVVRAITLSDVNEAWARGIHDFWNAPVYGLVFGGLYAAGGMIIVVCVTALGLRYLAYPLTAGFALIGPFAAVGLYEVSRRRETGLVLTWGAVIGAVFEQRNRQLAWMGFVTLLFFVVWMYQAQLLVALFLGTRSFPTLHDFLVALTTTPEGLVFLFIGNVVGAPLAIVLFSITFVSFPLLLDRDIDVVTAIITSVRAVVASPVAAVGWAITIVLLLIVASLPFFLGLMVALPILGHTTWHLYRKIVVSEQT